MSPDQRAEALRLADELLTDIELDRSGVDKQVLKASRLARLTDDEDSSLWLEKERSGYGASDEGSRIWFATNRAHDEPDLRIFNGAVSLAPMVQTLEAELGNMKIPSGGGDSGAIAVRETRGHISAVRNMVVRRQSVLSSVSAMIHNFASRHYHTLRFSRGQEQYFERAKQSIDGLLRDLDEVTLRKIDAAQTNLVEGDSEAVASAMLSVRRLIDSFSDAVFPPTDEVRIDGNGKPIGLGPDKKLNRIKAFVDDSTESLSRARRMKRAIADVYERVSTGVHKDVSLSEGEYLLISTYVLLGEILGLKSVQGDSLGEVELA